MVTLALSSPGHVSKEWNFCISAFSMCIREISHPLHFGSNAKLRDAKVMPLKKFHAIEGIVYLLNISIETKAIVVQCYISISSPWLHKGNCVVESTSTLPPCQTC